MLKSDASAGGLESVVVRIDIHWGKSFRFSGTDQQGNSEADNSDKADEADEADAIKSAFREEVTKLVGSCRFDVL